MKRFLIASATALLLISSTLAHKAASDEDDATANLGNLNANIPTEEVPFIENLSPASEEDVYQGPKDFQYCK